MKNCVIVGAADFDAEKFKKTKKDFVIAADKGYKSLVDNGFDCDLFIGDCDSLGYIPDFKNKIVLPSVKDDTDLVYALKEGILRGFDSFTFFGVLGGKRFSHSVSSVQTLLYGAKSGKKMKICDENCDIVSLLPGTHEFSGKGFFSLISLEGAKVDIAGAKYNGKDIYLSPSFPIGQSNEFTEHRLQVRVTSGIVLMITE